MEKYLVNVTWINNTKNTVETNNQIYQEKEEAHNAYYGWVINVLKHYKMLGYPCDQTFLIDNDDQKIVKYNVLEVCTYNEDLNENLEITISASKITA